MVSGMDDSFDFAGAGFAAPADWARLRDLVPDSVPVEKVSAASKTKDGLLRLLAEEGVTPPLYDPETVGRRNALISILRSRILEMSSKRFRHLSLGQRDVYRGGRVMFFGLLGADRYSTASRIFNGARP